MLGCAIVGGGIGGLGGSYVGGEIGERVGESERGGAVFAPPPGIFMCFTADTPVRLATDDDKPIDRIVPGEAVMAWDEHSGRLAVAEVIATRRAPPSPGIAISFANGRTVVATDRHRFLTQTGWVETERLTVGDTCVAGDTADNVAITSLERRSPSSKVYNLSVAPHQTYVAGGVVVHNVKP